MGASPPVPRPRGEPTGREIAATTEEDPDASDATRQLSRSWRSGKWRLRYFTDADGARKTGGSFPSKTAALQHFRDVIEPSLRGETPELTLAELAEMYLERHGQIRSPRTIRSLRERMKRPLDAYGFTQLVGARDDGARARRLALDARAAPIRAKGDGRAPAGTSTSVRMIGAALRCAARRRPCRDRRPAGRAGRGARESGVRWLGPTDQDDQRQCLQCGFPATFAAGTRRI